MQLRKLLNNFWVPTLPVGHILRIEALEGRNQFYWTLHLAFVPAQRLYQHLVKEPNVKLQKGKPSTRILELDCTFYSTGNSKLKIGFLCLSLPLVFSFFAG
jgi:hypothetical protein